MFTMTSGKAVSWTKASTDNAAKRDNAAKTDNAAKPASPPRLPEPRPYLLRRLRPYLLSVCLFAVASALMYVGDAALLRYGFSWALVSLLILVAVANLWGGRPAALVLSLSALYGAVVVPHLQTSSPFQPPLAWHVLLMRTLLLVACGAATIWLTYRARLMQGRAETRRGVVTALRATILPNTLAGAPGYDLSGIYKPLHHEEEVGGDFYDFYPMGSGRYGLLMGDVMGKGKEAAASIALLRYSVRAYSSSGTSAAQIMVQLNTLIETQGLPFETASLFLGFLDARSGCLCYANAGHEPPMLTRVNGTEETLEVTGPILGIGLGLPYEEGTAALGPGDSLFLMTDGVTEARNEHRKFLEIDGVWRLLRLALCASSAQQALATLDSALTNYIGANHCDDIAMLLLRRTGDLPDAPLRVHAVDPLLRVEAERDEQKTVGGEPG